MITELIFFFKDETRLFQLCGTETFTFELDPFKICDNQWSHTKEKAVAQ